MDLEVLPLRRVDELVAVLLRKPGDFLQLAEVQLTAGDHDTLDRKTASLPWIRIRQRPLGPGRSAVVDRRDLDVRAVDTFRREVRVDDPPALLHAQPLNHELESRGRPVVSVAVLPEEEAHGATDVRNELRGNERVEHACAKALPSHAAANHDAKALLLPAARATAYERSHTNAVDIGLSTSGSATGEADLELARQVVQVPRHGEKIGRPLRMGCHVHAGVRTA